MSSISRDLVGKVALVLPRIVGADWRCLWQVTGSSRGIGAAIALRLAQHGASIAVNYVSSEAAAEKVAEQARGYDVKAIVVKANVSEQAEIQSMFEKVVKELGRLDIVMSNSGIEHFGAVPDVTGEEIDRVFAVNVRAQYFVAQQAYSHLADHGRLILISSISAQRGFPKHAIYSASKAAIQGMVRSLAYDFGPRGITVNSIAPGGIKSDMYVEHAAKYFPGGEKMTVQEVDDAASKMSPMGRPGFPDDIAGVVAMLAGPESQWLTGQTLQVGGGAHMT